jgi:nicotinate-nucleotide adenylyltransferase
LKRGFSVGLLGGSFNPAHGGHRQMSLAALDRLGLDEVWWLVSPQNPLKPVAGMAPLAARLGSARRVARHPRIRVTAIEAELGTQLTIDTVQALKARFPQVRFLWLMGSDNLLQFHRWVQWRSIATTVPIVVMARPHYVGRSRSAPAMGWLRRFRHRSAAGWRNWHLPGLALVNFGLDQLSATALRAARPDWASAPDDPGAAHVAAADHSTGGQSAPRERQDP